MPLKVDLEESEATTLPLNLDLSGDGEKVIVPLDVIKASLKNADFIGGMDSCLCREANDCKDYPHNLGCLFLVRPVRSS